MGLCSSRQNAEGSYDPSPFTLLLATSSKVAGTHTCPCVPPHPDPRTCPCEPPNPNPDLVSPCEPPNPNPDPT